MRNFVIISLTLCALIENSSAQYRFIPNDADYVSLKTAAANQKKADEESFPKNNHRIIFNFDQSNSSLTTENFSVKHNEPVIFIIKNFNTQRYKIDLNHNSFSFPVNTEAASKFSFPDVSKDVKKATSSSTDLDGSINDLYTCVRELNSFYDEKAIRRRYDNYLLEQEQSFIAKQIGSTLNLRSSSSAFLEKADNLIKKLEPELTSEKDPDKKAVLQTQIDKLNEVKLQASIVDKVMQLSFEYHSAPVQPGNYDILQYKVVVTEGEKKIIDEKYDFNIWGHFRVNYGTGLFYSKLKDLKYIYGDTVVYDVIKDDSNKTRTDTVKAKVIRYDDDGSFTIGVGVMAHFYYKTGWWHLNGIGASIGTMIDNQTNTRYMLGGALTFGQDPNLTLTGGIIAGKISTLATGFHENQVVRDAPDGTVPTKNIWDTSWYVGLTYNFGGKEKTSGD